MKNIDSLHNEAMVIAQKAFIAQKNGNEKDFIKLSKDAFLLEKQAAMTLKDKFDIEPNRAILFKSAAFLAFDAKEYNECKDMRKYALSGDPYPEIKIELEELKFAVFEKLKNQWSVINSSNTKIATLIQKKHSLLAS